MLKENQQALQKRWRGRPTYGSSLHFLRLCNLVKLVWWRWKTGMRANPGRFEFGTVEDPHTRQDFQAMDLISRQWNLWRRSPPNVKNDKVSPEFVAPWRSSWQCPVLSVPRRWDQRWRSGRPKWQTKWQRLLRKVKLFAPTSLWPGTCRQPFESTGSADCIWKTPNPNTCTTNKNCCLHWHVIRWCIIQHTSQSTRVRAVVRPKSWEGLDFFVKLQWLNIIRRGDHCKCCDDTRQILWALTNLLLSGDHLHDFCLEHCSLPANGKHSAMGQH